MTDSTPTARRSIAGAVATSWLVVAVILWVGTIGLWYMATHAAGEAEQQLEARKTALDELTAQSEADRAAAEALSAVVGYRPSADALSDPGAIQIELDGVKSDLGDELAPDAQLTVADAIAALRTALSGARQSADATKSDLGAEVEQRKTAEGAANDIESNYTGQVAELNQQLADANQRADNQSQSDMRRFDELMQAQQAADEAARAAQQTLAEVQVQSRRDLSLVQAQLKAVALRREPRAPEAPDGEILTVGAGGSIAFIDIGRRSGLRPGTRFEVLRPAENGELVPAGGMVEVRELQDNIAMVGLMGEAEPLDPILPGDKVRNPHFDKSRVLNHYLLGEFPLNSSKDFVAARLSELGATVDDTLGTQVDVLVLGERPLGDAQALDLTDTDEYKLADKLGMRIIRLAELDEFLRY
ncbi:MAG TPA: hypothetical protein VFD43_06220 [Planctomycetota bacterium]|nr:hypothetical protein [Planctomycetota bacterium]